MAQATPHHPAVTRTRGIDCTRSVLRLALGAAAMAIAAPGAQAQGSPCDQVKQTLAAKLHGDVRSYTLEAVPSNTPLPAGAKFIGTCEGGAKKIMYRKGNPPPLAAVSVAASKPVPVATATSAPKAVDSPAAPPVAKAAPAAAPPSVAAARAPAATPPARTASTSTPTSPPPQPAPVAAAPALLNATARTTDAAASGSARGEVALAMAPSSDADDASEMLFPARSAEADGPSITDQAAAFASAHWPWAAGFGLAALLLALGAWAMHRRHYDASGLPRGPRL